MVREPDRTPSDHAPASAEDGAPVPVAVVGSRIEADLIVGLLLSNGLEAAVVADDAGGQEPQWQLSGVRVLVPAAHATAARDLLAEQPPGPAEDDGAPRGQDERM